MTPRGTLLRAATLLAAASLTASLAASCADRPATTHPDAPARVETPGTAAGTVLELVHESGLVHRVAAQDGHVLPPLLVDGAWSVTDDGRDVAELLVGDDPGTEADTSELGRILLACWTGGDASAPPEATTPDGVRCTQSLVTRIAAQRGYDTAADAIDAAHDLLGDGTNLWSWYCGIAGDAAATGAVLGGTDGRELIRTKTSFCDYSVPHGTGAAVALLNPDRLLDAVTALCAPDPGSDIPEASRTSQCWHGAGNGIARLTRLDAAAGARICAGAPDTSSHMNCIDGLYSFMRTYRLRGEEAVLSWPALDGDPSSCSGVAGEPGLLEACYRSAAQILVRDTAARNPDSESARDDATRRMLAACDKLAPGDAGPCWAGLGTLVAFTLHPDISDRGEVARWVALCDRAPDRYAGLRCYDRVTIGIVRNDQLVGGLDVADVVALIPDDLREDVRPGLENWVQSLGGRSE